MEHDYSLSDPPKVSITVTDSTSVNVQFIPPAETTGITIYRAVSSEAGSCFNKAGAVPLLCTLSGFEAGKQYTISAYSCSTTCSYPHIELFTMTPLRTFPRFINITS